MTLTECLEGLGPQVIGVVRGFCGDWREEEADLMQTGFVAVIERYAMIREADNPMAYAKKVFRSAVSAAVKSHRRDALYHADSLDEMK